MVPSFSLLTMLGSFLAKTIWEEDGSAEKLFLAFALLFLLLLPL
jgi:hypothetical protein